MPRRPRRRQGQQTVAKSYCAYKCSSVACNKTWNSIHGWTDLPPENLICDLCDGPADIFNSVDEMLDIDAYVCDCGNRWETIHQNDLSQDQCNSCNAMVHVNGIQNRFGRHYFYKCKSTKCGAEWENADTGRRFTQRCTECWNSGIMTGVRRGVRHFRRDFGKGDGVGTHNVAGCDMCQSLISKNVAMRCTPHRKVQVEETYQDGVHDFTLTII